MAAFGIFCLSLALMVAIAVVRGYVLSVLWGWFVAPTFSIPEIGIAVAIGLSTAVGLLTAQGKPNEWDGTAGEQIVMAGLYSLLISLFALCIGWAAYQFV